MFAAQKMAKIKILKLARNFMLFALLFQEKSGVYYSVCNVGLHVFIDVCE